MIDPTEDAPALGIADDAALKQVANMAHRLTQMREREAALTKQLAALKQDRFKLETMDLPDALAAIGLSSLRTHDGRELSVVEFCEGTVPTLGTIAKAKAADRPALEARRRFVLNWLREHGHGGLIKTEVTVAFGKGEDELAQAAAAALRERFGLEPQQSENIAPQTWLAFIREMIDSGEALPLDDMGVTIGRKAVIK